MPDRYDIDQYKNDYLTTFAQGYYPENFHNRKFIPGIPVLKDSGRYKKNGNRLFLVDDSRAPRTNAKTIEIKLDSFDTYSCIEHALGSTLDIRQEIQYAERVGGGAAVLDLKERAVKTVKFSMETSREVLCANLLFNPAKYASTNKKACTSTEKWNTTTGDILAQIDAGKSAMYAKTGVMPNAIVMGRNAYTLARKNAKLIANYLYTEVAGKLSDEKLKELFEVKHLFVVDTMYENQKGIMVNAWDTNTVSLLYVPTPEELSLGLPVHTTAFNLVGSEEVKEFQDKEVLIVSRYENYDIKHVSDENAYLISGVA